MTRIPTCAFALTNAQGYLLQQLVDDCHVRQQLTGPQRQAIATLLHAGQDLVVAVGPRITLQLLTREQRRLVLPVGRGLGNKGIARELGKSAHTIANQLKQVFHKCGVRSRAELARRAVFLVDADGSVPPLASLTPPRLAAADQDQTLHRSQRLVTPGRPRSVI